MKILVTGNKGYVGKMLCPILESDGHEVSGVDVGLYETDPMQRIDCRHISVKDLGEKPDLIIHLAAIVGEPACSRAPSLAKSVNLDGTINMVRIGRELKIPVVLASSCSVYGAADHVLFENSTLRPLGAYARDRMLSEREVLENMGVAMRFGTLFGLARRMRFDLVVNKFAADALKNDKIRIEGGDQWRPFTHVLDAAMAMVQIVRLIEQGSFTEIAGEIFNVAGVNVAISELGNIVRRETGCNVIVAKKVRDMRNYRVSSRKLESTGWKADLSIQSAINEITAWLKAENADPDEAIYSNEATVKKIMQRAKPDVKLA